MNIRRLAGENSTDSPRSENRARTRAVAESVSSKSRRYLLHTVPQGARFDFGSFAELQALRPEREKTLNSTAPK